MCKRINGTAFNYSNGFLIIQKNYLSNMLIVLSCIVLYFFLLYCYATLIKVSHKQRSNILLKLELSPENNHPFPIYICKLRTCRFILFAGLSVHIYISVFIPSFGVWVDIQRYSVLILITTSTIDCTHCSVVGVYSRFKFHLPSQLGNS